MWASGLILLSDLIQTILGFTAANSWLIFIRLVPPFKTYMTAAPTVTGMLDLTLTLTLTQNPNPKP